MRCRSLDFPRSFVLPLRQRPGEGGCPAPVRIRCYAARERDSYQRLVAQLNNLRQIMEKPEVYF